MRYLSKSQVKSKSVSDIDLSREEIEEKYKGKLQTHMTGPSFEIVSRLMKSLSARKITIPGSFTG